MRKEDKFSAHAKKPYYAVVQEAFKPDQHANLKPTKHQKPFDLKST
jgi:hypothetical protein